MQLSPPRQRIAIYETALLKIANGEVKDPKREALLALQGGTRSLVGPSPTRMRWMMRNTTDEM